MLVLMKSGATETEIERVLKKIESFRFRAKISNDANCTSIDIIDGDGSIVTSIFENFAGVAETIQTTKPYKLASRNSIQKKSVVKVGATEIGGAELTIIGGVCAIETPEQAFTVAEAVKKSGAKLFRGGALNLAPRLTVFKVWAKKACRFWRKFARISVYKSLLKRWTTNKLIWSKNMAI